MEILRIENARPSHVYEITPFEAIAQLFERIKAVLELGSGLVVTDENVITAYPELSVFDPVVLPAGESTKQWDSLIKIVESGLMRRLDRQSTVVAFGGGVIGDVTGFGASVINRGTKLIQVPSTLLSMVDSSVGGKTGINAPQGKNLIGAFYAPHEVFLCPSLLETLPVEEVKNGLAEMIKHGILGAVSHFEDLEKISHKGPVWQNIVPYIQDSIRVKQKIVEEDELEMGVRGFLNLGHTFGHSIESLSEYRIPHGHGVAIGCMMAIRYAIKKGICDPFLEHRVESVYQNFDIDVSVPFPEVDIFEGMKSDKKRQGDKVNLVLPEELGKVRYYPVNIQEEIDSML